jgi:hypothetical protein
VTPCVLVVIPSPPTLPTGFSWVLPLPHIPDPSLKLCCQYKLSDFLPIHAWPPNLAFVLSVGTLATINAILLAGQQAVQDIIDQFIPVCPRF